MIRATGGRDYVGVDTPDILSCTEQRWFWVTWQYGAIEVGRGEVLGDNKFMDYQPLQMYPVNAIGYSTGYDYNGTWFIKAAGRMFLKFDLKYKHGSFYVRARRMTRSKRNARRQCRSVIQNG